ncbi:NAD(P)H-binding protein [Planotetraspora phitsanulokensis]|uniref:NAD(P)H-binding protein n=1 Tax=Planotetraspora phitsanulokensis TaxID=575192 RepID=UPI00194FFD6B|nr:NAD(P)H-binding protein [Planotetraspora phitsanulokensis]
MSGFLVIGATGNVGRHVVARLRDGGGDVRALARRPAAGALPDGVHAVQGDLADPRTLDAALDGVTKVFLLWPFLSAEAAPAVVDALARNARHVVYLSAMSVRDDLKPEENGFWGEIEHLIERSALDWTFLRVGGLAANTLGWADQIRTEGVVRWPYGAAARSLIHERDVAAVAARALLDDGHAGAKYVLTGPEAVTQADQVRLIGEAIGRPVRWEELPPERAREQLLASWGDAAFVDGALGYWATLADRPEPVTHTVEQVTGVPARTFGEWAREHARDFSPA